MESNRNSWTNLLVGSFIAVALGLLLIVLTYATFRVSLIYNNPEHVKCYSGGTLIFDGVTNDAGIDTDSVGLNIVTQTGQRVRITAGAACIATLVPKK